MIINMGRPRRIPGTWPTTTVQKFLTEAEAEVWIERQTPGSTGISRYGPDA
jgi:hypothetical protein